MYMMIPLTGAQLDALKAYLDSSEDAEALSGGEYVADIYELEPPVSLNLEFTKGGIDVLAAAELKYDEALDGWYLAERILDADALRRLLLGWPPIAGA